MFWIVLDCIALLQEYVCKLIENGKSFSYIVKLTNPTASRHTSFNLQQEGLIYWIKVLG